MPPGSARNNNEDLLSVVLQNCNTNLDIDEAARLLCTSQATADLVRELFAGTLDIRFQGNIPLPAARLSWLAKNAALLGELEYRSNPSASSSAPAAKAFTAALARAAALPAGLMLRSLSTSSLDVLHISATCRFLTCLDLTLERKSLFPSAHEATACITGLGGQLRSLKLHASWELFDSTGGSAAWNDGMRLYVPGCGLHSLLRAALPGLEALTCLEVDEVPDACLLNYAPQQLKRLEVMGVDDQSNVALELGHLTGLTYMRFSRHPACNMEGWRVVNAPDVLPTHLRELSITDCTSATPLLSLTQLTLLSISEHCHMPVEELKRLSVLTQLKESHLGYNVWQSDVGERAAEEGCAGWGSVPALRSLELHRQWVQPRRLDPSGLLMQLAGLTDLTRLVWDHTYIVPDMGPYVDQELADAYKPRDGGMYAVGAALPPSLVEVSFLSFVPYPDEYQDVYEADIVLGVRDFKRAVLERLPLLQLELCTFDPECHFSNSGRELVDMLLKADLRLPEVAEAVKEAFFIAYPNWRMPRVWLEEAEDLGSADDEMGSEGLQDAGEEAGGAKEEGEQGAGS